MKLTVWFFMALLIAAAASSSEGVNTEGVPFETRKTSLGRVLTNSEGMAVYTFARDKAGKSNCHGACAENWPPVEVFPGAEAKGDFSIIEREDDTRQWAYKDQPLYLWVGDSEPGEVTGPKVNDAWFVVKVDSDKAG